LIQLWCAYREQSAQDGKRWDDPRWSTGERVLRQRLRQGGVAGLDDQARLRGVLPKGLDSIPVEGGKKRVRQRLGILNADVHYLSTDRAAQATGEGHSR